jgi:iron-sulfur cluster insertion protein
VERCYLIIVTEAARKKIASMCLEQNMEAVRPFVMGGGCSGMQHSLTFAEQKEKRDTEIAPYLYIDPVAYQFMDGATIDYDTSGMSPTFVFHDVFKEQGGTGMCGGCGAATGPGYGH